jgi:FAD/FMN-containing dehydrogenase
MSELDNKNKPNRDFSKFDNMSSGALNNILKADLELGANEGSDMDMILYIMEVLAKREEYADINTDKAWDSFQRDYLPYVDEPSVLDELEPSGETAPKAVSNISKISEKPKKHFGRKVLRFAVSLAAAIALLMALGVTASAMGYDLFGAVVTWTNETFSFKSANVTNTATVYPEKTIPEELDEFAELLDDNGLDSKELLPGYLPEGYSIVEIDVNKNPGYYNDFYCAIKNDEKAAFISFTEHFSDGDYPQYQKDDGDPKIYEVNGTTHYIMSNCGIYYTVYFVDNLECVIYGCESEENMVQVINSIYY